VNSTLDALQATLAAEHAAVHCFGTLGAQTSQSAQPELAAALREAHELHRTRRDDLVATIRTLGVEPVAAAAAYALPNPADTVPRIQAAARELEVGCAQWYADLVANTAGDQRAWAVAALSDSAVRVLGFGGRPETFPGMPDLA